MGFHRQRQPAALSRVQAIDVIKTFVGEQEIARILAEQDVFLIESDCVNPAGHGAVSSCGEVVCPHCAKVFWR
ncbi:hypothetical protein PMI42_07448 [Bradyrhizobium sp. YR681]|uniref:hypothetical protein n=1 Tax=Bradyrhizobium sp. YR681 TaxID=1144344 RepID=UPI00026F8F36|nr:hypothetical protein [Bradyrhizobium sp. YR681]EJN07918.1 hypothetical protein PMI42_07448 [Bradyrhizobium sp. YR681]